MTLRSVFKRSSLPLSCLLLLSGGAAFAQGNPVDQSESGLHITGAGSTFAAPIIESWINVYQTVDDTVEISYDSVGSGEGMEQFLSKAVDIGATDAPLSARELAAVDGVQQLPLTAGMIGITYNMPELGQALRLSREAYTGIFLGKIDRWDDPLIAADNPALKLPAKLIQLVVRGDSSGTTNAFTEHLASVSPAWAQGPGSGKRIGWPGGTMHAPGNEGVAGRVKLTLGSIGYVESGFADRLGLPMAQLENRDGEFVAPTVNAGQAALASAESADVEHMVAAMLDPEGLSSYPITACTWILVRDTYDDPDKQLAVRKLLRWSLTDGQSYAEPLHYIALPAAVTTAVLSNLDHS